MKKILTVLVLATAFFQPLGASPHIDVTPVSLILDTQHNTDFDDKYVKLVGRVTEKDDGTDWWFTDSTGTVRIETGCMDLPVGKLIVIEGQIDQGLGNIGPIEVEVDTWDYAHRHYEK